MNKVCRISTEDTMLFRSETSNNEFVGSVASSGPAKKTLQEQKRCLAKLHWGEDEEQRLDRL